MMIRPSIYKIKQIGLGILYIMPKPSGQWLEDDISYFKSMDINIIVSLLEDSEAYSLGLDDEKKICHKYNIKFIQIPTKDRGLPNKEKLKTLVSQLLEALEDGKNIAIHCRAGIGRAGLLSACILKTQNIDIKSVIEEISTARKAIIPDTDEQYEYILKF